MTPLSLTDAYKEYLERMVVQSDDLVTVDSLTIPTDFNLSEAAYEWADFV